MATAFALALDALFYAPGSDEATYQPRGNAQWADPIRVIRGQPDQDVPFGSGRVIEGTNRFEIRRSDVAEPMKGDVITIGATSFRLLGEAMIDVEGLTWSIGGAEVA